jgi:multiple sugar transport system substrate-binding protein
MERFTTRRPHRIFPKRIFLVLALLLVLLAGSGPAFARQGSTFVYWGGLIFSDEANTLFSNKIKEWGQKRNIPVEVVMINQNETVQKVSAAIEAGTMPDALDLGVDFALLLSRQKQLASVDKLFEDIGKAHGGWFDIPTKLVTAKDFGGSIYGVPYGVSGNVLFRRNDVLSVAGFPDAPKTWEDVSKAAKAAQKPPQTYGMGFAISNVGDANLTTTMLQSWGGRIADDEGKKCTIDSPETRAFLDWITKAYADGLFPPGVTTWDGAGDNTAYQSGNALFIANTGSVFVYMRKNDPDLEKSTLYSALPAGPKMRISPANIVVRSIPVKSKYNAEAADLLAYLADDAFVSAYFNAAIYGPVLKSEVDAPIFKESKAHAGLLDLATNGTPGAFPDLNNAAFAEYQNNFLTPKMVQRIVVDKVSIDQAIKETQAACQLIYDKNNK